MKRNVAIIGGGQTYHKARRHDVDQAELVNEAVRAALEDARMTMDEIDLVLLGNMEFFEGVHMTDCWLVHGTGAYGRPGLKITTGGTVGAVTEMVKKLGGEITEAAFLIELEFLGGRKKLEPLPVYSVIKY